MFPKVTPARGHAFAGVRPNRCSAADKSATRLCRYAGEWPGNVDMADALIKHVTLEA